jgi:predicted secreted protein
MPWYTILAIYFIFWWLIFFTVLPWGVRSQEEQASVAHGTDPGAPAVPGLKMKLVWTTIVSAIVFGAFYWAYITKAIAFEDIATLWGLLKP